MTVPTVSGCADLDGDNVGDCKETLAANPDFASDVGGWAAELDAVLTWDEESAAGTLPSGSALLAANGAADVAATGSTLRDATQCLAVSGSQLVTAYANAFVEGDQDTQGQAEVDVFFFDAAGCSGAFSTNFSTPQPLDATRGSWITLKAGAVTGPNTKSMSVKLSISKPNRAASFRARFDNVLIRTLTPSP